jgi:hypothetical protein
MYLEIRPQWTMRVKKSSKILLHLVFILKTGVKATHIGPQEG